MKSPDQVQEEVFKQFETPLIGLTALIIILIAVMAPPASAFTSTTLQADNANQYSFTANEGQYIYQILIDPLPIGTNQTHVLNAGGATFLLSIKSSNSWVIFNKFTVSMTYPNGTVEEKNVTTTRLSDGTYKTHIQPIFQQFQDMTPAWKIDLFIGTNPTTLSFNSIATQPPSETQSIPGITGTTIPIPFTSVSGEFSGVSTNVFVYECSIADFAEHVSNWDPFGGVSTLGSGLFSWTWGMVTGFIGMIPIVGPQFLAVMDFIGSVGGKIIFWILYIITHFYLVFAGIEILITMFAYLNTGKRASAGKIISKWADYNITVVKGFLWILGWIFDKLMWIVQTIAHIINSIH